jgi:protein-L-isoaspartate(D-aspartate) O-methyltransferase
LAEQAEAALAAQGCDNVAVVSGKLTDGAAKHGPYDVIIIEGAAEVVPQTLVDQLKDGGRIACLFMEDALGVVRLGTKDDGIMTWRYAFNATAPILPGFAAEKEFAL